MKKITAKSLLPVIGGILLIAAGVVFLLNNMGLLQLDWEVLIGPLFAIGGLVFLLVYILNTSEWWALIPGFALIGIGAIVFMGQTLSPELNRYGGAIFMGFLGLPFLLIFITHREYWWALIPGGVLLSLALVNLTENHSLLSGAILFLGTAITFFMVYILPKPAGKLTWALYPAGVLGLIGVFMLFGVTDLMNYILPVALLIAGGYVLYRGLRRE